MRSLRAGSCLHSSPFARPDGAAGIDGGGRPGPVFAQATGGPGVNVFAQVSAQAERWAKEGRRLVVAAWTRVSGERLAHLLRDQSFPAVAADDWAAAQKQAAALVVLGIERGFVADGVAFVSEQDMLGERISRPPRRRKRADQFIAEATEIAEGDLVVHGDHGIGRYDGLVTLHVSGAPHDCLRLLYDGDDKLFLPVENIEMLSRYGSESGGVALDKLGGTGWQARKARMKSRIRDMAGELIRPHRGRAQAGRCRNHGAAGGQLGRVLRPLPARGDRGPDPRDRRCARGSGVGPADGSKLICGDVGFGKTEVALRAAFIAAMSGGQVAVVVPTTLLARQHFRTFRERFAGLPVKVAQLSRMVTAKEAVEVRKSRRSGRGDQDRHRHPRADGEVGEFCRIVAAGGGRGTAFRRCPTRRS